MDLSHRPHPYQGRAVVLLSASLAGRDWVDRRGIGHSPTWRANWHVDTSSPTLVSILSTTSLLLQWRLSRRSQQQPISSTSRCSQA
jgi:hypothetical protein